MDLDEAIDRHAEWKIIFRTAIEQKLTIDVSTIKRDNCCALGTWLHGEGMAQYGDKISFSNLLATHAAFHCNAVRVADAINARKYDVAERLLDVLGEYAEASLGVIDAIEALQMEMAPHCAPADRAVVSQKQLS